MALAIERNSPPVLSGEFGPRWDYGDEEIELLTQVIRSGKLSRLGGTMVVQFERDFAAAHGVKYAQATTSGSASVHTAVGTMDPNPGDEIITTAITDFGTVIGILYQNAVPVFADVDPMTGNLDPASVEALITDRTRAILPVHLYGNPFDVDAMLDIARRHNLMLIEDCCQAQCATWRGKPVGSWGDFGADKGNPRQPIYEHYFLAPNYRMTDLQGAVGVAQQRKVQGYVDKKRRAAQCLDQLIGGEEGITLPPVHPHAEHSYWVYSFMIDPDVFGVSVRDFAGALRAEGMPANGPYLEYPISKYPALTGKVTYGTSQFPWGAAGVARDIDYANLQLPGAERFLETTILMLMNQSFTDEHIEGFGEAVRKVARTYRDRHARQGV
jgi:perosamine synthetase